MELDEKDIQLLFHFTDTGKMFSLFLRKGVLEIQPFEVAGSSVQVMAKEEDIVGPILFLAMIYWLYKSVSKK